MSSKVIDNIEFLNKLCPQGKTPEQCGIMLLDHINTLVENTIPPFTKRGTEINEFCILAVNNIQEIEGIVKLVTLDMIPPGVKSLERRRSYVVLGDVLPPVLVPIIINIDNRNYILLNSQKRLPLGGKVTIEIYRGSVPRETPLSKMATALIDRKLPLLNEYFDLIQIRDLGYYWNNTGISGTRTPIQALFYKPKNKTDISEVKKELKIDLFRDADPKTGPPLPSTEPVIKTFEEIKTRLDEVMQLPSSLEDIESHSDIEAYINDIFSIASLSILFRSIENQGLPF